MVWQRSFSFRGGGALSLKKCRFSWIGLNYFCSSIIPSTSFQQLLYLLPGKGKCRLVFRYWSFKSSNKGQEKKIHDCAFSGVWYWCSSIFGEKSFVRLCLTDNIKWYCHNRNFLLWGGHPASNFELLLDKLLLDPPPCFHHLSPHMCRSFNLIIRNPNTIWEYQCDCWLSIFRKLFLTSFKTEVVPSCFCHP